MDWLARVQHDLVKRVLWPARDRRDLGGRPAPHELRPHVVDDEGHAIPARELWAALRAEAPAAAPAAALDDFARALDAALEAAERDDVGGVLKLDPAFRALAASLHEGR